MVSASRGPLLAKIAHTARNSATGSSVLPLTFKLRERLVKFAGNNSKKTGTVSFKGICHAMCQALVAN